MRIGGRPEAVGHTDSDKLVAELRKQPEQVLLVTHMPEIEGEANGGMADLLEKPQGLLEIGEEATAG